MPQYQYTARDERGRSVSGALTAPDPEALADQLKRMGYLVTRAREVVDHPSLRTVLAPLRRIRDEELALFTVQLSKMVQVGIPLLTALETLAQETEHLRLRRAIREVATAVERGASFAEALQPHPRIFSGMFINAVRAGEVSGRLDEILRRLSAFARYQASLRQQVRTALTYPAILFIVGLAVMVFLVIGIIPKFVGIYVDAGVVLPWPTQVLAEVSRVLQQHGVWLLLATGAVVWAVRWWGGTPAGRRMVDALLLKIPVIGPLVRKVAVSRFARTLSTLLASGVPILEALAVSERTCGNAVIGEVVAAAQARVRQGASLGDPLRVGQEFPPMVVQMITVGELSGTLDHMLNEVADHYDELVAHEIRRATTFIEPVFLIFMGGMVAFIMASVLLPLFRMVHVIR